MFIAVVAWRGPAPVVEVVETGWAYRVQAGMSCLFPTSVHVAKASIEITNMQITRNAIMDFNLPGAPV